jgi:poly(ADP-ribose) glycohydrolase
MLIFLVLKIKNCKNNKIQMSFFPLPNYDQAKWDLIVEDLSQYLDRDTIESTASLIKSLGNVSGELKSFDFLLQIYKETDLITLFKSIKHFSLKLPELIPSGRIQRLTKTKCTLLSFTREQILCLLCHMFLCSVEKTVKNMYWVNFEKWHVDGRVCANAYIQSLIEYFVQSLEMLGSERGKEFMSQTVSFERRLLNVESLENSLADETFQLSSVRVLSEGSIGEGSSGVEVDFANCDIGYGVTGTQEEILFGGSPEMCIAMLFVDTMAADEAVVIKGARRVAQFEGYGLNLSFKQPVSIESRDWSQRIVIAIDSLDFSDCQSSLDSFKEQLKVDNLVREVSKAYAGFSAVCDQMIDTGNWGCGAFCGNRQLKALIQIVAASATSNRLNFYCFRDKNFGIQLQDLIDTLKRSNTSLKKLWSLIQTVEFESENGVFETVLKNL